MGDEVMAGDVVSSGDVVSAGDVVPVGRARRRAGVRVAMAVGLIGALGGIGVLSGAGSDPGPITLTEVAPSVGTAAPSVDGGGGADTPPSTDGAGVAAVDGDSAAADVPGAATATTGAGPRPATVRPKSIVGPTAPVPATGTLEERGAAALALINYPWSRTGYSIVFTGPTPNLLGLTDPNHKLTTIYIRATQSIGDIARVLGHEIGHEVDFTMTTDAERADYRHIRGLDDRAWYPSCNGCSDYASPVGDWAETFAFWLLGDGSFSSQLALKPTPAQLSALTPLFTADPAPVTTATTRPPTTTTTATTAPRSSTPRPVTPRSTPPRSMPPRSTPTTTRPTTTTTRPTTTTTRPTTTTTGPTTTTTRPTTTTTTGPTSTTTGPTTTTTGTSPRTGSTSPPTGSSSLGR